MLWRLPELTLTAVLGWLSQPLLTDATVTEYDCPHGKPLNEQLVLVELHDRKDPPLVSALTWKDSASGLAGHVTVIEPAEQLILTSTV